MKTPRDIIYETVDRVCEDTGPHGLTDGIITALSEAGYAIVTVPLELSDEQCKRLAQQIADGVIPLLTGITTSPHEAQAGTPHSE